MKAIFMLMVLALSSPAFGQTGNLEVPSECRRQHRCWNHV